MQAHYFWFDLAIIKTINGLQQLGYPKLNPVLFFNLKLVSFNFNIYADTKVTSWLSWKIQLRVKNLIILLSGAQGISIKASEDRGIPPTERLLPDYLRELGYSTNLVGKWGIGKSRPHYLPSNRGFDTFYGFLGDAVDYFTYNAIDVRIRCGNLY